MNGGALSAADAAGGAPRHEVVLLNANTTASITDRLVASAASLGSGPFAYRGVTAPFGEPYISTPAAAARAAEAVGAVVSDLRAAEPAPAALVIACFGDPGLLPARAAAPFPVIGMAEASCHVACQIGRRFSIVTGGRAWGPMLTDFVATIGLSERLASVRTLELTGDQIIARPEAVPEAVLAEAEAAGGDGADVVIVGGAALVGVAGRLGPRTRMPLLDSLACAIVQAEALVRLRDLAGPAGHAAGGAPG